MWFLGAQVLLLSAAVSWVLTPLAIRLGRRWGALDQPGPRKIHTRPIPRVGGVAVFLGMMAGLVYAAFATGFLPASFHLKGLHWGSLAAAALFVFFLGLVDDLRGLSFRWKFAVQIAGSVAVWVCGFRIEGLSLPFVRGDVDLGVLSLFVTVLWIVGVTNAINLIDGLDGLAAGVALISTLAVAIIALYRGQIAVAAASLALVGSLVGFLPYNFAPARIFLGDSGSMLLGFVLAVLSIHANQKGATAVAVLGPILVLGVPLLDTGLAIARRLYRLGKGGDGGGSRVAYIARHATIVFLPDRSHLHHRLLEMGLSHKSAVLTLYLGATITALSALSLVLVKSPVLALMLLLVLGLPALLFLLSVVATRERRNKRGRSRSPETSEKTSPAQGSFLPSWKGSGTPPE